MKRKTKNILLVSLSLVFAVTCLGLVSKINNSDSIIPPVDSSDVTTSEEPTIEPSEEVSSEIISSEEQSSEEISNEENKSDENLSNDESSDNYVQLYGWHLVTSLDELEDHDYITFVSNPDSGSVIGDYNSEVKRFNPVEFNYSCVDNVGSINTDSSGAPSFFQIEYYNGGYAFKYLGESYLTSVYSSSNTCKLGSELSDYTTFDVHFENDHVIAISRGDKKCNTIKCSTSYFSLYTFESSNFPYLMKYYGDYPDWN